MAWSRLASSMKLLFLAKTFSHGLPKRRAAGTFADMTQRFARLGDCVVAFPFQADVLVSVVEGIVISVSAAESFPEFEPLSPLARNERASLVAVKVPFADVARFVAGPLVHLGNGDGIVLQPHIVQEHTVCQRVLSRQQARAIGAAHRAARDGVLEVDAFGGKLVQVFAWSGLKGLIWYDPKTYDGPNPPKTWQQLLKVTTYFNGKDYNGNGKPGDGISLHLKVGGQGMFHFMCDRPRL